MEEKESGVPSKSAKRRQRKKAKEQQKVNKQNRAALILNSSLAAEKEEVKLESCPAEIKTDSTVDKEADSSISNPSGSNILTGLQDILGNISRNNTEADYLYCPVLKQSFFRDNKSLESKLKTLEPDKLDPDTIWKVIQEECETGLSSRRDAEGLGCYGKLCKASDFFAAKQFGLKEPSTDPEEDHNIVEAYPSCGDPEEKLNDEQKQTPDGELKTYESDSVTKKKVGAQKSDIHQVHSDKNECEDKRNEAKITDSENICEEVSKTVKDNSILTAIENLQASISKVLEDIRFKDKTATSQLKVEMGTESIEAQEMTLDESGMSKAQLRAARKQQKAQQKALKVQKSTQKDATESVTGSTQKDSSEPDARSTENDASSSTTLSAQNDASGVSTDKSSDSKPGGKETSPAKDASKTQTEQGKSKAQLKKERRELQEAQRAAKLAEKQGTAAPKKAGEKEGTTVAPKKVAEKDSMPVKSEKPVTIGAPRKSSDGSIKQQVARVPDAIQVDDPVVEKKLAKKLASQQVPQRTSALRKVKLFRHLEQYDSKMSLTHTMPLVGGTIHPSVIKVGLQMSEGMIRGANARCIAMLSALKNFIIDYRVATGKELHRDLETRLKPQVSFLKQCRDLSVSMGNAIRFLKMCITQLSADISQNEAKTSLITSIEQFVKEKIELAEEAISQLALEKIHDNDVILTYGWSSAVLEVLKKASSQKRDIHVVVVDGRAHLDGKCLLQKLVKLGIPCSYCMLGAVPYHMPQVTKVLVGAHALLANGYVMSDCGMSQVALMAQSFNTPLLVCCETYKFSERVQTDAFVFNELGDPDDLVSTSVNKEPLKDWRDVSSLTLLNLHYDVTPPQLVSGVITELGMLPCTSVPVVLRLKYPTPV